MVDAKICMASERNVHKGQVYEALRNRFPEIPEQVVSETLAQHGNLEMCMSILAVESDRYLYGGGDMFDSPIPVQPTPQNHPLEPISISIPPTTTSPFPSNSYVSPLQPLIRPMTVAQSSPGMNYVSAGQSERQPSSMAAYNQAILQRQQQRLEKLRKEFEKGQLQLIRIRHNCQEKEEEMVNKKFRIARNPSATDVRHLKDENRVLREEIEQMTREIDGLSSGIDVLGPPLSSTNRETHPESIQPSRYPPQVRKSSSFPRVEHSAGMNGPTSSLQRFCSMLGGFKASSHDDESPPSLSPPHDSSLEREWIFLPPDSQQQQQFQNFHCSEETTWSCAHCTFANHEALDICEVCEMPRNRAQEARA